ncbi:MULTISPECIES: GNAT family N-acetyltransferase [Catenuloplanes]|uniref:GNAT family acetyltransferase n=1 Tax=Catenuloplanes niger TaxID=587534 RepID=A0AAE4CYD0_9ACTN|nr:GNAT family N-acetyltransferase [Catenuloplanes niger]MDR7325709.1 putative GNAT family acetyltransferase [Catenuloplanes niger]
MSTEVRDNAAESRFEIVVDGTVAGFAAYRVRDDALIFTHTEVDPGHEGQGLGSTLAAAALDAARERGATVVPRCAFIKSYIERHPDYQDLVAG